MPYSEGTYSIVGIEEMLRLAPVQDWKEAAPFTTIQALTEFVKQRVRKVCPDAASDFYINIDDLGLKVVNAAVKRMQEL